MVRSVVVRTCVGCRQRDDQSDLLRVVASGTNLVADGRLRQAGRGAYVHPRTECLHLAERRRAFPRALRVAGPLSMTALAAVVQTAEMTVRGSGD